MNQSADNIKVYIIIPFHNLVDDAFADCLKNQDYRNLSLILVDDGSTDESLSKLTSLPYTCHVINGDGNLWFGGALDKAYTFIEKNNSVNDHDIILVLLHDTQFGGNFISRGAELIKQYPNSIITARAVSKQTGMLVDKGVHVSWWNLSFTQTDQTSEINCLSMRGMFATAKDFIRIGGFYPVLLPHYLSDYEFCIRAFQMGYMLRTFEELIIYSDESRTGYHSISGRSFIKTAASMFSKKYALNPIYRTNFILLCCPLRWKLINILRVWIVSIKIIIKSLVGIRHNKKATLK
ncbi:MAG TPA: hypothetical protein DET40_17435 [Lentisphaeria bacterium]|nr:MAG: hypothetical protein A2X45_02570 [Lentisphaerae bacterium GWF2_50_93]HCE45325.1 hypothetical protein [Lentisphaeria bacterium]